MGTAYSITARHWFVSEDGQLKVPSLSIFGDDEENSRDFHAANKAIQEYKWKVGDFLLETYPKNGTHILWEIMNMLLRGNAEYISDSKITCMMDLTPLSNCDAPSPRVLNTHLRLDVLPQEFRGRKTVWGLRNPKDTVVSFYLQLARMDVMSPNSEVVKIISKMSFSEFLREFLFNKSLSYGSYSDYVEYMWSLKDLPNIHLVFFEDLKIKPTETIQKINEFMGTDRSPELVQQIADATSFSKMKKGKLGTSKGLIEKNEEGNEASPFDEIVYRKGEIGDWKNYFTVADNELFDSMLEKWTVGKEIPFIYQ